MNERFGILHLSDIHASEKSKVTIQRLVGLLKTDIQTIQERHNVSIKMICISGDLINSGDDADAQLVIILEELLQPLMDFVRTLLIYGGCLKNLELLPKKEKETMYNDYNLGLCIMLGIFKKNTEEYFNGELSDMEELPEKYTDEDIREIKALMQDVLKITIPIVLQNIALENVGTTKLKSIIEGVIKNKNSNANCFRTVSYSIVPIMMLALTNLHYIQFYNKYIILFFEEITAIIVSNIAVSFIMDFPTSATASIIYEQMSNKLLLIKLIKESL